ncbi:trypco2 family protein [Streptomyces asoensis]|uniref:trypco2 family protein n=1 Tax=Streptomyces asoensis TaxID=249586 RepID=UPI003410BBF3
MTDDAQVGTELGEAIEAVRRSLAWAACQGEDSAVRFTVDTVQLEFAIEVRRTGTAGGGVRAWVVSADGRDERARTSTQRITVCLRGDDALISSEGDGKRFGPDPDAGDHLGRR